MKTQKSDTHAIGDTVVCENPHVDLELIRRFREIKHVLDQVPSSEAPKPIEKPYRQPIPPKMYL